MGRVDDCVAIAEHPKVIFTTFGDAMRVPGSTKSLLQAKADGADVRIVYSPLDALALARANPDERSGVLRPRFRDDDADDRFHRAAGRARGPANFSLFCNHITIIPTIKAILDSPDLHLDGFLGPGHVSDGDRHRPLRLYRGALPQARSSSPGSSRSTFCSRSDGAAADRRRPLRSRKPICAASCPKPATAPALTAIARVFELREFFEWRGLGSIDHSGVRMRDAYARLTPNANSSLPGLKIADPKSCQCGEVLKGVIKPWQCKVFGARLHPGNARSAP